MLWVLLAAATLAVLAAALLDESMPPVVLGIRLVKSAALIAVSSILLWKCPRDPVGAILGLAFLCWTITSSVDFTSTALLPLLLERLRFLLFAVALLLFPDGKWRPRWTRKVGTASFLVFALGAVEVIGIMPTHLFLPLAILCVLAAILSLVLRFRRTSSETQRQQLKWVAFGLVAGVSLILSARTAVAVAGPMIAFEIMFQLGIVFVALGFLVPLLRYRLYDAETVISRSVGYAVLTATLVATFAGSEALIELLGQQYLGSGIGQVSGAMAAALAAVLLAPLNDRISHWAEQHFQRDLVQLKMRFPELLRQIPQSWSLRQIGDFALSQITDAIHATNAAIMIEGKTIAIQGITARSIDDCRLQLPLRCHFGEPRGVLLIGPRPDGSSFGKDEIEAIKAALLPLSRALLGCLDREKSQRRARDFRRSLSRRLEDLSARIETLQCPACRPY